MKKVTICRKIQLNFNNDDKDQRDEFWNKLKKWRFICRKAANILVSIMYTTDNIKDFSFFIDDIQYKLADFNKDGDGMLKSHYTTALYRVLSEKYLGELPANIITNLNTQIKLTFDKEKTEYFKGERSLRNYRKNIPIPFSSNNISNLQLIEEVYKGRKQYNYAFSLFGLPFRTYFGKDKSTIISNYECFKAATNDFFLPKEILKAEDALSDAIVQSKKLAFEKQINGLDFTINMNNDNPQDIYYEVATTTDKGQHKFKMIACKKTVEVDDKKVKKDGWKITSDIKFCASSITVEKVREPQEEGGFKEKTKIFLNATFQFVQQKVKLDDEIILYASLDPHIPVIYEVGGYKGVIGSGEDYLRKRNKIQEALRRVQRAAKYNRNGKGRDEKIKAIKRFEKAEKHYIANRFHYFAKQLVLTAVKYKAKKIVLVDQEQKEAEAKENPFLLRNWSYYSFNAKIEYKSALWGIDVEKKPAAEITK